MIPRKVMTDTETTTTAAATFADELLELGEQYQDEQVRASWRNEQLAAATTYFLDTLLASDEAWETFQENARINVKSIGKKTVSLLTWQGRGPSHQGQLLVDLLDLGELLEKLQDVLDLKGGKDRFLVFKHSVNASRGNGPRMYSLTVSWDQSGFEKGREIIAGERVKAEERVERNMRRRLAREEGGDDDEEDNRPARRPARREHTDRRDDRRPARRPHRRDDEEYEPRRDDRRPARRPRRRDDDEEYDSHHDRGARRAPRRRPVKYDD